jgi:hypothetical protein
MEFIGFFEVIDWYGFLWHVERIAPMKLISDGAAPQGLNHFTSTSSKVLRQYTLACTGPTHAAQGL